MEQKFLSVKTSKNSWRVESGEVGTVLSSSMLYYTLVLSNANLPQEKKINNFVYLCFLASTIKKVVSNMSYEK